MQILQTGGDNPTLCGFLQPFSFFFFQMGNGKEETQLLLNSAKETGNGGVSLANLERLMTQSLDLHRDGAVQKKKKRGGGNDLISQSDAKSRFAPWAKFAPPAPGSGPSLRRAIAGDSRKRRCALREALLQRTLRKHFILARRELKSLLSNPPRICFGSLP